MLFLDLVGQYTNDARCLGSRGSNAHLGASVFLGLFRQIGRVINLFPCLIAAVVGDRVTLL